MQDSPSTELLTKRNGILFLIAVVFLLVASFYSCLQSSPKMSVSKELPPTFHLSGRNRIIVFEVVSNGKTIWRLFPKEKGLLLNQLSAIKYSEVPSSCVQAFPEDSSPPPQLIEGEKYHAFAGIFDASAIGVAFTIKDGKVIDINEEYREKNRQILNGQQ